MPQASLSARLNGARIVEVAVPLAIAVALGMFLVARPFAAAILAGGALVCGIAGVAPRATALAYACYVLVQDLVLNFASDAHWSFLAFKRGDEAILLLLVLATAARHTSLAVPVVRRAYVYLAAALGVGAVSTLFHADDWMLAALDVFLLTKGFLVFYVVSHLPAARRRLTWPLSLVMVLGCVCLVAAAVDLALGDAYRALIRDSHQVELRRGFASVVAIFGTPGVSGWFFAFCACVALAFWVVRRRSLHLVLCFAFSIGALLSLRRKPLIGLILVFAVALLMSARTRSMLRTVSATVIIVGSVAWAAGDLILGNFQDMLAQYVYAPDTMAIARNAMLRTSVQIAFDYFPLGAGFGKFGGLVSTMFYSPLYHEYGLSMVHGLTEAQPSFLLDVFWPHVLGELGFIGAACFIGAMGCLVVPHLRAGSSVDPDARIVRYAALFCFLEAIPESFGWVVFENSLAASWIFGLLALAMVATRLPTSPPARDS